MVETEVKKKGFGTTRWVWVLVALAAVFVAMAMSSSTSPRIALFGAIDRACQCARVISLFKLTNYLCLHRLLVFRFPYHVVFENLGLVLLLDSLFSL